MSTSPLPWELWSTDVFDRDAPPMHERAVASRRAGLEALWRAVLREAIQHDGKATFTDFSLRGPAGPTLRIPRDPFQNPELAHLRARLEEPDFTSRLAELHERLLEAPFSFAPFLALPVALPQPVTQVALALAKSLGRGEALTSQPPGWRCGERVEIRSSGYTSGNAFESGATRWTVEAEGLVVTLDDVAEAGWYPAVSSDGSAGALVLRDALSAAGW